MWLLKAAHIDEMNLEQEALEEEARLAEAEYYLWLDKQREQEHQEEMARQMEAEQQRYEEEQYYYEMEQARMQQEYEEAWDQAYLYFQ